MGRLIQLLDNHNFIFTSIIFFGQILSFRNFLILLHLFVHSTFSMFWQLHLSNLTYLGSKSRSVRLLFFRFLFKVTFSPICNMITANLFSFSLNFCNFFFRLSCLNISDFFVLLLSTLVNFTRSLVTSFTHILTHNLAKCTVVASICEYALWLLFCF